MDAVKPRILIVDDDDRNVFALKTVLASRGFHCATADSGLQALDALKLNRSIELALIDMMMPGIDGYELIGMIQKIPAFGHVKLIAVTAQAMAGDKEKCLEAGANGYVSKPIDIDALLKIIDESLIKNG